jgi:cytosine/adenosine deaminase-related metal-dependent hydrolase
VLYISPRDVTTALLLKSGIIVTQDRRIGVLPKGDVLIEGHRIARVAPELTAPHAEIVDCAGHFVLPGLINAHMHTWQTGLRSVAANWTLLEYFRHVHAGLATVFTPDDIHIATVAGALNQLDHGVTTLVDWCHNNPTPAHTDAGVAALKESGIRAAFFHGSPKPDPKPGQPHFSEVPHPRGEVERLLKGPLSNRDGLVTLGLAILGPHYSTLDVSAHDFALARELGLIASMHQGGGEAKTPGGWEILVERGLVGPYINVVHGNNLSDDQLKTFVGLGVSFSVTPENEMMQGHGYPITGRLRALGSAPSIGVDLESAISGDMFVVARMALACQRAVDNATERAQTGGIPTTSTVPAREALDWITTCGAAMLGMSDRIGSLAPGKQADIAVMSAGPLAMWPVHDAVASVVMQGSGARVRDVLVAGRFAKRDGRLTSADVGNVRDRLTRSGERILARLNVPSISRQIAELSENREGRQ